MALKNLFDMVKADRYTQDGREELIKAQEEETEDARRTYQIGEISEATGLQKTAQGWKPPKETKFGKVKQNKEGQWGVQTKQGKGSDFLKHKSEKEASRALANYTAGYNTTERSKQDPHSDQARQVKHWDKETEKIRKQNRAEGRTAHAEAAKKGNAERQDKIEKLRERAFNKTELEGLSKGKLDNLYKSEMESQSAAKKETPEEFIKNAKEKQRAKTEARLKEEQARPQKAIESARQNFEEYKKENPDWQNKSEDEIYRELGKKAREAENKPGKTDKPNPNGVVAQQKQKLEAEKHEAARKDAQAPSKKTEVNTPGLRKDVQEAIKRSTPEEIKAYIKELRTPGSRMSRYFDNPDLLANVYEDELNKMTESKPTDSAPRVLTGDTRIRVRKA